MTNLNDEKIRQELIRRYLSAETTLEEEHLLANYLSDINIALSTEEEDILLMLQTSNIIGRPEVSEEKAEEFDRLMQRGRKKSKIVAMRWIVSVAAAVICVVLFLPVNPTDNAEETPELTMVISDGSDITSTQEIAPEPTDEHIFVAENSASVSKKRKAGIRKQTLTETVKIQDISTSELLETINILSDVGIDDMTITASSCNDGFVIRTSTPNGLPNSYILKRCSDGTSIELKSQLINF